MIIWPASTLYTNKVCSAVDSTSDCRCRDREFEPKLSHITFVEVDHEIISVVIIPLQLIQERQLSVNDKNMCISTG